ncbi:MAG: hypothetical protein ACI30R_05540 [Sodaliphilus sp.]
MKGIVMMALVAMGLMMGSCSKGAGSVSEETGEAASAAEPGFENGVTYENPAMGFSVQLPQGFSAQNDDRQMEAERGGKVYVCSGKLVDMQAFDKSATELTPEEMVSGEIEVATASGEVLEKKVEGAKGMAKVKDEFGYRAFYVQVSPAKMEYCIAFTYPLDQKQAFDTEVDKIAQSLKVTK